MLKYNLGRMVVVLSYMTVPRCQFFWVVSLGGGSTVTSLLPGMPKTVLGGCLATLVSFVKKVFLDCTMQNFVFVLIGDLK